MYILQCTRQCNSKQELIDAVNHLERLNTPENRKINNFDECLRLCKMIENEKVVNLYCPQLTFSIKPAKVTS